MDRADPRAGEHGNRRLGDHRHVDRHALAAPGAQCFERIGHAADLFMQIAVGQPALLRRVIAFPDDRHGVAPLGQMPVKAIGRDVERAVGKPFDAEISLIERAVAELRPRLDPVKPRRFRAPERLGLLQRTAIHLGVTLRIDIGALGPFGRDGMRGGQSFLSCWHRLSRGNSHAGLGNKANAATCEANR